MRTTLDSLQEFRVTTGNYDADSGRSSGAQVNLVTKSGTNAVHGSLYEYYRPNFDVANDWFNKQAELEAGLPNVPGFILRNTFGGTVGGPIKKDRAFFFIAYEGQRTSDAVQTTREVPTQSLSEGYLEIPVRPGQRSELCIGSPNSNGVTVASGGSTFPGFNVATLTPDQVASLDQGDYTGPGCAEMEHALPHLETPKAPVTTATSSISVASATLMPYSQNIPCPTPPAKVTC